MLDCFQQVREALWRRLVGREVFQGDMGVRACSPDKLESYVYSMSAKNDFPRHEKSTKYH